MSRAAAAVYVVGLVALVACTIGPAAGGDGGTASTSTAPPPSLGDQCRAVLGEYCQKAASCALPVADLNDCINNALPLCCSGSQCDAASTNTEATVTDCEQTIDAEDCNIVANTTNPTTCLQSS